MTISIVDYELPDDSLNVYEVTFFNDTIMTMVTNSASSVDSWISRIESIHRRRLHRLIVGLDVEWRPNFGRNINNPVATLQLCVGRRCLIFQLLYADGFPESLIDFLSNRDYTFVGVGIDSDVEKLMEDHDLEVVNTVDLRLLAMNRCGTGRNAGLRELAREVLGIDFVKPRRVTLSRWDNEWLIPAQVQYACVDAFVSFELGRVLNAATTITNVEIR